MDVTEIYNRVKDNGGRLYPTLIWWIANAVNHFEFLRFNHDENGDIGYYNEVNPSFTFMPKNCFDISAMPWVEFTSFNLNVFSNGTHLPPIFTTGKLIKENGSVKLPFCLQVHHSICDGYHAGQFFDYLQNLADEVDGWLK